MPQFITKIIDENYELRIESIFPKPDEMVKLVYRFTITASDGSKFIYRMAFSKEAMETVAQGRKLIQDPLSDAKGEVRKRLQEKEYTDLRLVRGRDGWFEPD